MSLSFLLWSVTGSRVKVMAHRTDSSSSASQLRPPAVSNASTLRARYHDQRITFLGDNAIGNSHLRDLALAKQFTQDTGVRVDVVPHPVDGSYAQLVNAFRARSTAYDVVMIDVIYLGAFEIWKGRPNPCAIRA